jgi:hypothetical protein
MPKNNSKSQVSINQTIKRKPQITKIQNQIIKYHRESSCLVFSFLGLLFFAFGFCFIGLSFFGSWNLVPGSWSFFFGTWNLVPGI